MRHTLLFFLAAGLLRAQDPQPLSIQVDVSLVNFAFIVRDAGGAPLAGLTKDDVEVYEDGVRQQVRSFGRSSDMPLKLALVMDVSGSQDKFNKAHAKDVQAFVSSAVEVRDNAMLICFGDHIRLVRDFTGSAPALVSSMTEFQQGYHKFPELAPDSTRMGGTALFDSVFAAAEKFGEPARERRAIIVFSDGEDNSSGHDLADAIEAAQTADAVIYTVRYTEVSKGKLTSRNRYGMREMERLAAETGGLGYDASRTDVAAALRSVAEELRSMYEVSYVSSNPARDGRFRKVEIRVKRDGVGVRARPGYYAR